MGVDVLGWVQAANPPDFDLPRKENPRRKLSEAYSVRSAYCGPCMVRSPNIRLAHSCGSLANCVNNEKKKIKKEIDQTPNGCVSALDQFKKREQRPSSRQRKEKKAEQRIIDLLTVKAALSVLRESCWYWGNISGEKAKQVLKGTNPGTFLLRDSSDQRFLFSMTVMTQQGPTSVRLVFSRGAFRVESSGLISPRSPCVVSLIYRMSQLSKNKVRGQPIQEDKPIVEQSNNDGLLKKPLYSKVPDLKHFARLAVNRYNLRNFTQKREMDYIRAYPYPI